MKQHWFLALLLLLGLTTHAQALWPRNSRTSKVEYIGTIPWPDTVRTDRQRKILVRRWYLAKLTDLTATELTAWKSKPSTSLTYADLPGRSYYSVNSSEGQCFRLRWCIKLSASPTALVYQLIEFEYNWFDDDVSGSGPLEFLLSPDVLQKSSGEGRQMLRFMQQRLTTAISRW